MNLAARIVSIFLIFFFLLVPFAHAQTSAQSPLNTLMKTDSSTPLTISTLTQGVFIGILSSATCFVGGVDFFSPHGNCLSYNKQTQTYSYSQNTQGGLLGMEAGAISLVYTAPFHTTDYLSYLWGNFGIVKQAHAANGIGFDQLSPITSLWIAFRNLSYLLFVIIFIVIGFAIMLRAKIDPRTVMTIENQIPKLIVALFLITFSFAIAGLIIDLMWVGIYLIINLFASLDPQVLGKQAGVITATVTDNPFNWVDTLNTGPLGFLGIAQQAAGGIKDMLNVIVFNIFQQAGVFKIPFELILGLPTVLSCFFTNVIHISLGPLQSGNDFGGCLDAGAATLISSIVGAVAFLIFAIALLVAIGRVWWNLIKSYALFIILTIFGPLAIMSGVIPASKTNFEYWIRHMFAYTIVFPTTMAIFLLGKTLMDVYSTKPTTAVPPLIGVTSNALTFMGPLLGFIVMMMAPQALRMVQDALNAQDPKYLAGIGQSLGVGSQAIGSGVGKLWDRSFRESDPLRGLDEGWAKKLVLGRRGDRNILGRIIIGKETGTGPLGESKAQ